MTSDPQLSPHTAWAHLRFSIVGRLLSAPPAQGELKTEIEALSRKTWRHPTTGKPVRFAAKTIERWYYKALRARRDAAVGEQRWNELEKESKNEKSQGQAWKNSRIDASSYEHFFHNRKV